MTIDMTELEAMERELDTMVEMSSSNGDLAQEIAVLGALRELGLRAGRMQRAKLSRLRGRLGVKPGDRVDGIGRPDRAFCDLYLGSTDGVQLHCALDANHLGKHVPTAGRRIS